MIDVSLFIDWDSARRVRKPKWNLQDDQAVGLKERVGYIEECFADIQTKIIGLLEKIALKPPVRVVRSRIYHGWHRGESATMDRRAWEEASFRLRPLVTKSISFLPDIEYGNNLSCGGSRVPLLDTLRRRDTGEDEQKMVDTALTSDLLSYCRTESRAFNRAEKPKVMALVLGDDDDLFPGVVMAESWGLPIRLVRVGRRVENKHLETSRLVERL